MSGGRSERPVAHSLVQALRHVPDLAPFDDQTLLRLLGASATLFWPEGRTVFEKGTAPDGLYIVISGEVAVVEPDASGGGEVARIGPGGYFGELSLFFGDEHSKDVETTDDCELMVIPKESFQALLTSDEELADHFRRVFEDRAEAFRR